MTIERWEEQAASGPCGAQEEWRESGGETGLRLDPQHHTKEPGQPPEVTKGFSSRSHAHGGVWAPSVAWGAAAWRTEKG